MDDRFAVTASRYVVSFIVGYPREDEIRCPLRAARAALRMTREIASGTTVWFVFDRITGLTHRLEQEEFEQDMNDQAHRY